MRRFTIVVIFLILALSACNSLPQPASPSPSVEANSKTLVPADTAGPEPSPTSTPSPLPPPTATQTLKPSPTTAALLDLEILEWAEYSYANLADPQNTDTRVEILVRNPNELPVRVNLDKAELRLLDAAGETVYTNPNPIFYIWEGSWILGSETVPVSACACFDTDGVTRQAWESLELVAPLEAAPGIAYTTDVDVSIGEFFSLEEAHLGGDQMGTAITLVNTSDQVLKSFEVRVIARDAGGKYVGTAFSSSFADWDSTGNYLDIEPSASSNGIVVSEIDYVNEPLEYELTALGMLAEAQK